MGFGELKGTLSRLAGFANSAVKLIDAGSEIHRAFSGVDVAPGTLPRPPEVTVLRQLPGSPLRKDLVPVRTLEERVSIVCGQIIEGRTNTTILESAAAIVSKQCRQPNGRMSWCLPPRKPRLEIDAVFYAVRDRLVRYTSDPIGVDMFSSARASLKRKAGDCSQLTASLGSHLGAIGHPCELVVVREKSEADWNHIYLRTCYVDEQGVMHVVPLDPSTDNPPGWEVPMELLAARVCFEVPGT